MQRSQDKCIDGKLWSMAIAVYCVCSCFLGGSWAPQAHQRLKTLSSATCQWSFTPSPSLRIKLLRYPATAGNLPRVARQGSDIVDGGANDSVSERFFWRYPDSCFDFNTFWSDLPFDPELSHESAENLLWNWEGMQDVMGSNFRVANAAKRKQEIVRVAHSWFTWKTREYWHDVMNLVSQVAENRSIDLAAFTVIYQLGCIRPFDEDFIVDLSQSDEYTSDGRLTNPLQRLTKAYRERFTQGQFLNVLELRANTIFSEMCTASGSAGKLKDVYVENFVMEWYERALHQLEGYDVDEDDEEEDWEQPY